MLIEKGYYQHYKGNYYEVLGVVRHSETLEVLVLYKALYLKEEDALWVRPLEMFEEKVNLNGNLRKRFTFIGKELPPEVVSQTKNTL
jgi:hypothetical protein